VKEVYPDSADLQENGRDVPKSSLHSMSAVKNKKR
jgi:hypothetical protein